MPAHPSVIAALNAAVQASPDDLPLRLHLGSVLLEGDDHAAALEQFTHVLGRDPVNLDALRGAASAAERAGDARAEGYRRLLGALAPDAAPVTPSAPKPPPASVRGDGSLTLPKTPAEWDRFLGDTPKDQKPLEPEAVPMGGEDEDDSSDDWLTERPEITLADVGGMDAVKRRLNIAFLAPMRNPEYMKMYGKSLRGGLLLYGPPGCGKTFIARALAGELGARFISVGLADVLDMWLGNSEKQLQSIFDTARRNAPCVLFFDEIDALGQKRSHLRNNAIRNVVNQLLAEMDSMGGNNDGVFMLGATNHPWDVDTALRRPGRFDRLMLVLPPDAAARDAVLQHHLKGRPADGVDVHWVAEKTDEYSGADLAHLCETAAERPMDEAIRTGRARPMHTNDFKAAMKEVRPSTRSWFEVARNYAMFANEGGTYDDLLEYIKARRI